MNFKINVNKELAEKIMRLSQSLNQCSNSIINEALEEWLSKHDSKKWPEGFFDFEPIQDVPDFEVLRKEPNASSIG